MKAQNPKFEADVRASAAKQGLIKHLGINLDEMGEGWLNSSLIPGEEHSQQDGFVHAGALATIADLSGGYAAMTLVPAGKRVLTVEFKISLMRPAVGEKVICRARVLKPGKTVSFAESEVFCINKGVEKLVAKASVSVAILQ